MTWFAHRLPNNVIASLHREVQPGYAEEALADNAPEVIAFLTPPPSVDLSNIDNLEKAFQAMGLLLRDYTNALQAGTYTTKTIAQLKADFKAKYILLP